MLYFLHYLNPIVAAKNVGTSIYSFIYGDENENENIKTVSLLRDTSVVTYSGILLFHPELAGIIHASLIGYVLTLAKIIGGILLL